MSEIPYAPCADRANEPQDWFIRPDGKQYPDDDLLTEDEGRRVTRAVLHIEGETTKDYVERVERALKNARAARRRQMLTRRRQAQEKCYSLCEMREQCLRGALERREGHGTWGGLLEEELYQVRRIQDRRRRRMATTID